MRGLTTGDVSELTGIPQNTLDRWCGKGVVTPGGEGKGRGKHRRWSVSQAVALTFAGEWRAWGAGWPLIEPMIRHLVKLTDTEMLEAFAEGRTHLLEMPIGALAKPAKKTPELDQFDFERVYKITLERIAKMESGRPKNLTGRNRGLVGANT